MPPFQSFLNLENRSIKEQAHIRVQFYETWYSDGVNTIIPNKPSNANKRAIIVGVSYAFAFKWIVSIGFNQVTSLQDFLRDAQQITPIRETIDSSDSNYVFFVTTQDYINTAEKFPSYFD